MDRTCLVCRHTGKSRIESVEQANDVVTDMASIEQVNQADYVVLWTPGDGFHVVRHRLDTEGNRLQFRPAPEVVVDQLDDFMQEFLGEKNLTVTVV